MFPVDALVLDGRFRILEPLGKGGVTETYLAEQATLGRKIILKVLLPELGLAPDLADRFADEVRRFASVDHPSVVRVLDFGRAGDLLYLVTDVAEGSPLRSSMTGEPMLPDRAAAILQQVAEGLAAIHGRGLLHRDLRPENVFVADSPRGLKARLADFAIARLVDPDPGEARVTLLLKPVGQPQYVSPEQAQGKTPDARSDLYAFGVLAFELLSGKLPFDGPGPMQYLSQHQSAPPQKLEDAAPHLKDHFRWCELVARCLEKDPARRPQTAAEVADRVAALPPVGEATLLVEALLKLPPALPPKERSPAPASPAPSAPRPLTQPPREPLMPSIPMPVLEPAPPVSSAAVPTASPPSRPRRLMWMRLGLSASLAALLGSGALYLMPRPAVAARKLLRHGQAGQALEKIESAMQSAAGQADAELHALRAVAYHQLGRHRDEAAALRDEVAPKSSAALDPLVLSAELEDYADKESPAVRDLLHRLPKEALNQAATKVAKGPPSAAQWGALRYLDGENAAGELDLVQLYTRALEAQRCADRRVAARRLGQLDDAYAQDALRRLKDTPRSSTPERNCGQDEAAVALQRIGRH